MNGSRFTFPSPDLSPWVWVYIVRDESVRAGPSSTNRFPAVVYPSLSILLRGSVEAQWDKGPPRRLPSLFVSGAVSCPVVSANLGAVLSVTVLFRPGVMPYFSGERPDFLVDTFMGAEALWPREAAALQSRVAGLSPGEALPLIEDFLRRVLRQPRRHGGFQEPQREPLAQALARLPLKQVVAGTGLSLRQFERRFAAQYGMTPKLFQRVRRFERAAHCLRNEFGAGARNLAAIAAECGYFDQSHLVKEFQRFSGLGPTTLLGSVESEADYWVYRMSLSHD